MSTGSKIEWTAFALGAFLLLLLLTARYLHGRPICWQPSNPHARRASRGDGWHASDDRRRIL